VWERKSFLFSEQTKHNYDGYKTFIYLRVGPLGGASHIDGKGCHIYLIFAILL